MASQTRVLALDEPPDAKTYVELSCVSVGSGTSSAVPASGFAGEAEEELIAADVAPAEYGRTEIGDAAAFGDEEIGLCDKFEGGDAPNFGEDAAAWGDDELLAGLLKVL